VAPEWPIEFGLGVLALTLPPPSDSFRTFLEFPTNTTTTLLRSNCVSPRHQSLGASEQYNNQDQDLCQPIWEPGDTGSNLLPFIHAHARFRSDPRTTPIPLPSKRCSEATLHQSTPTFCAAKDDSHTTPNHMPHSPVVSTVGSGVVQPTTGIGPRTTNPSRKEYLRRLLW